MLDARVITMEISESKKKGTTVPSIDENLGPTVAEPLSVPADSSAPSARRVPRRKGSLVVYDNQPLGNRGIPSTTSTIAAAAAAAAAAGVSGTTTTFAEPLPIPGSTAGIQDTDMLASSLQKTDFASVDEGMRRDSIAMLRGKLDVSQVYEPPAAALLPQDTDVPPPVVRDRLVIEDFPVNTISTAWIKMVKQGLSEWVRLPVIICRGSEEG